MHHCKRFASPASARPQLKKADGWQKTVVSSSPSLSKSDAKLCGERPLTADLALEPEEGAGRKGAGPGQGDWLSLGLEGV